MAILASPICNMHALPRRLGAAIAFQRQIFREGLFRNIIRRFKLQKFPAMSCPASGVGSRSMLFPL
jgi:hypothetical protein